MSSAEEKKNRGRALVRLRGRVLKGIDVATILRHRPDVCELCGSPPDEGKSLFLDHNHTTGKFRGWLCCLCNIEVALIDKWGEEAEARINKVLSYARTENANNLGQTVSVEEITDKHIQGIL